jgi:hypothetical protein
VGAIGRSGPVASDWSEKVKIPRPVASVWSGGVGLVCGMRRGILIWQQRLVRVQLEEPTSTISDWRINSSDAPNHFARFDGKVVKLSFPLLQLIHARRRSFTSKC